MNVVAKKTFVQLDLRKFTGQLGPVKMAPGDWEIPEGVGDPREKEFPFRGMPISFGPFKGVVSKGRCMGQGHTLILQLSRAVFSGTVEQAKKLQGGPAEVRFTEEVQVTHKLGQFRSLEELFDALDEQQARQIVHRLALGRLFEEPNHTPLGLLKRTIAGAPIPQKERELILKVFAN